MLRAAFPGGHGQRRAEGARDGDHRRARADASRGIYAGAVGYISFQDDMDTAIALRTAVLKDGVLYAQARRRHRPRLVARRRMAGDAEQAARAVLRAAEMVQQGLDEEA